MPGPSCSRSRIQRRVSHFWLSEPGQPGTTSRSGPPCRNGSGLVRSCRRRAACAAPSPFRAACRGRSTALLTSPFLSGSAPKCAGVTRRWLSVRRRSARRRARRRSIRRSRRRHWSRDCLRPGLEERAPVAAAFEHHPKGLDAGSALLRSATRERSSRSTSPSTTKLQASGSSSLLRQEAVVADEEARNRRRLVVEQILRRLGHQRRLARGPKDGLCRELEEAVRKIGH